MRLAKVGFQKEQKHFTCSKIFMVVAFEEFGAGGIPQYLTGVNETGISY